MDDVQKELYLDSLILQNEMLPAGLAKIKIMVWYAVGY
jgi:hypothetical protein